MQTQAGDQIVVSIKAREFQAKRILIAAAVGIERAGSVSEVLCSAVAYCIALQGIRQGEPTLRKDVINLPGLAPPDCAPTNQLNPIRANRRCNTIADRQRP